MTSQTKKFIEIEDILGLRFECKNPECGASLWLPLLEDINRTQTLQKCPNCGHQWTQLNEATYELQFKTLVTTLRTIAGAPIGCRFSLEIKPESQLTPPTSTRGQ